MPDKTATWFDSTDGVRLALHDLGGSGPTVLICHAAGLLGRAYEPLAAQLRGHAHVHALDFRAHGDSSAPCTERLSWAAMVDDLGVAVEALDEKGGPITVFGHSMGGAIATMLEHRSGGCFRRICLFDPVIYPRGTEQRNRRNGAQMVERARRRRSTFPSRAAALDHYRRRPPFDGFREDALVAYIEHGFRERGDGTIELKCAPQHEASTLAAVDKPTVDDIVGVRTPVTVGVGGRSGRIFASIGEGLVSVLADARLDRQPCLTHFGPFEDPDAVADIVLRAIALQGSPRSYAAGASPHPPTRS